MVIRNIGNSDQNNYRVVMMILVLLLILTLALSIVMGRFSISLRDLIATLFPWAMKVSEGQDASMLHTVIFNVRLPRIFASGVQGSIAFFLRSASSNLSLA